MKGNVPAKWVTSKHEQRTFYEQMDGLGRRPAEFCPACKSDMVRTVIMRRPRGEESGGPWTIIFTEAKARCPCC